jgi:mono/diheme cytochrome c family protein
MKTRYILGGSAVVGAAAAAIVVYAGWYDISATDQHLAPTYRLLDKALRQSVKLRASRIEVPALDDPAQFAQGLAQYRAHCVQCHGAPGVAPEPFALGLTPAPANLAYTAKEWRPAEIFWVIKHGIKMTGMPAWLYRMSEEELWATTAFVMALPTLSPLEYAALPGTKPTRAASIASDGDAARGRRAIQQYICVTCHEIPGIVGPNAPVGPPLEDIARRGFIAGVLPNSPANMVRWLRNPKAISPDSAMPDLGVTEQDARDMAAYLETLR